jgi:hypothetical protein
MSDTGGPYLQPGGLGQFAIKTCIVAVVLSVCAIWVANSIIDSAEDSLNRGIGMLRSELERAASIGAGGRGWRVIEREMERAAAPDTDLPPEKKQKLIEEIHVIVARWRPFLDAITTEMQKPASNPAQAR